MYAKMIRNGLMFATTISLIAGCSMGSPSDETESHSEVATANMAGAANGTENNGSFVAMGPSSYERFNWAMEQLLLVPVAFAHAAAGNCREIRDLLDCAGNNGVLEIAMDLCKRGRAQWHGTERLEYSSVEVCEARTHTRGVPVTGSVVRSFVGVYADASNPATYRQMGPRRWSVDTTTPYGYNEAVSGGTFVQFSKEAETESPLRTIQLRGIRIVSELVEEESDPADDELALVKPHGGGEGEGEGRGGKPRSAKDIRWDESISTAADHPIQIRGAGADKVILAGSVTKIQNNELEFTATTTVMEELKFQNGCCHPASGSVKTEFTPDKNGLQREAETLTFSGQCGVGEHRPGQGQKLARVLKGCF